MPLDGHAFLLNQGWSGTGTGLRDGAISRPITASQKRNLSGIGKDRDEAFPFWDHLFTVAASAIQIECFSSDDDDEDRPQLGTKDIRPSTLELRQTSTGILCNRPPIAGTPASSGASTPTPTPCLDATLSSSAHRPSLLSLARRETARRGLYSRFFRGPVLGPDDMQDEMVKTEPTTALHTPSHPGDTEKSTKKESKIDACEEHTSRVFVDKEERKLEKSLLKEAERAARKAKRHKEKRHKAKCDVSNSKSSDERIPLPSQEQSSGLLLSTTPDETPHVRSEKKKKKRRKEALIDDELDAQPPVRTDERTRKDPSNFSKKRRRRDQSP